MFNKSIFSLFILSIISISVKAQCPTADGIAGNDITVCAGTDVTLNGQLPAGFTGTWTEDVPFWQNQQGSISDDTSPTSDITDLTTAETITVLWTITDGGSCTGIEDG